MTEEIRIGGPHPADCCCERCVCFKEHQREEISKIAKAVMGKRQLASGDRVPEDDSHAVINPATGMQREYVVLAPEERAKGFVKPVRHSYVHRKCGAATRMSSSIAETYARDPHFYSGTFCVRCGAHFPLFQFEWEDGEPMEPSMQEAWAIETAQRRAQQAAQARHKRMGEITGEIMRLEAERAKLVSEDTPSDPT